MKQARVPPNVTRSTKLQGAQRFPGLAFRNTVFRVQENLIFPALYEEPTLILCFLKTEII